MFYLTEYHWVPKGKRLVLFPFGLDAPASPQAGYQSRSSTGGDYDLLNLSRFCHYP